MARSIVVLLLAAGCASENQLGKAGDYAGADGPAIEVTPREIDFGELGEGEEKVETFTVTNVGAEESVLEVSDISFAGDPGGFTIVTPPDDLDFDLPAGATKDIEVMFTPFGVEEYAEVVVTSNDEEHERLTVTLLGAGLVPELEITPDPLDFGTVYLGCDKPETVTLTNVGTDVLTVTAIGEAGDGFTLASAPNLPFDLRPGDAQTVELLFTPSDQAAFTGELTVESTEPRGTRTADQTGEGKYAGEYEDVFEVPEDPPSDIVFFVDHSCSMDDDARALADQFSAFITELNNYTTDWHIMVTNDDDGCHDGSILRSDTSNYVSQFETYVMRGGGVWTEAGLTVTAAAIDKTDSGECNDNFLREDALLHIIMVSDEPEQSMRSWDTYVNEVITKKGDAGLVKFSAVAGDVPGGCSSRDNSAEPGTGYKEAADYTGGEFLSLCDDWSAHVGILADASITLTTFELSATPVESTIAVSVNGREQRNGWSYDSATNAVVFEDDYAPVEGDTITVTYGGLATCD
ncbi:MAG: choice-of-anchor D domain-containing protein [Myxococcota bacterium]